MLGLFFQFLGFNCFFFFSFLALSLNSSFIAIWALSFLLLLICFLLSFHCKTSILRFLGLCMVYLIWVVCWLTNLVGKTASAKLGWRGQLQFLAYQSGQKRSFFYRFPMVIPVVGNSAMASSFESSTVNNTYLGCMKNMDYLWFSIYSEIYGCLRMCIWAYPWFLNLKFGFRKWILIFLFIACLSACIHAATCLN